MHMVLQMKKFFRINSVQLPLKEQYRFLDRLHRLLENGYPLLEALDLLQWEKKWEKQVQIITKTLQHGKPLDEALRLANFNKNVVSFLYFSMTDGDILSALKHCRTMIHQQMEALNHFEKASRYPFFLLILFVGLLYFIKTSIYPSFLQLFHSLSEQSVITLVSIQLIDSLSQSLFFLVIISLISGLLWLFIRRRISIQHKIKCYLLLPLVNQYYKINISFLFSLHMSSLLAAGMSLKECLAFLSKQTRQPIIAHYSNTIINKLENGHQLDAALSSCSLFVKELRTIFHKNTNNEALVRDLSTLAQFLTEQLEEKVRRSISLIQPIFFIFMGGVIIFIYLSLMLPMFQLIQQL